MAAPATGRRRSRRQKLVVRGQLDVPDTVLPWERDLLLPIVLRVLTELLSTTDQGAKK